ncbi:phage tail tape measure protein [Photobacterium sagamiensis]|uniref:phage tail tape measure protein n=1 Tax=Photobacterium sagamiensis TaxID=2910241 RepID=UPI003D10DF31
MLPEALRFQVGLVDQISKPLGNIKRQLNDVTNTYREGTHTMMAGAAGMVGAGFALQAALMPAIEMDRVLGEVKSLGVADDQLQQLSDTALNFAVDYGKSATDFVAASYDIKSAMGAMSGDELAGVTQSSAILAAATKADTGTITSYMGTMYSVFKDQADAIGKDTWAEQLAGQTAKSVEMFKTTGAGMSDAFKTIGALGKKHGASMTEQMAVLGMLQGSMSGAEAGTKYKAFLSGVVGAQDKLGLSLVDSSGKMLPMFDILNKLKGKFGELDSVEIGQLKTAFGSDEAVLLIADMMDKTGDLKGNMQQLNDASNIETAKNMAAAMTDQWERLEQGLFVVSAAFGQVLLPAILPVVGAMADSAKEVLLWTKLFPNLTKYIGFAVVGVLGLVAAGGMFTLMMGVGKQAMAGYMLTMKLWAGMNWLLTQGMATMKAVMLALNIVIAANPIVLVVAAVVAAIAAVGALIYYWDDLKASFGDTAWFQMLEGGVQGVIDLFNGLLNIPEVLTQAFSTAFDFISSNLLDLWESMKGLTDWIPGFGGDETEIKSQAVQQATPRAQIPSGGAAKSIASYQTSSTNYGGVAIYPTYMSSPQDMASELEMAAG